MMDRHNDDSGQYSEEIIRESEKAAADAYRNFRRLQNNVVNRNNVGNETGSKAGNEARRKTENEGSCKTGGEDKNKIGNESTSKASSKYAEPDTTRKEQFKGVNSYKNGNDTPLNEKYGKQAAYKNGKNTCLNEEYGKKAAYKNENISSGNGYKGGNYKTDATEAGTFSRYKTGNVEGKSFGQYKAEKLAKVREAEQQAARKQAVKPGTGERAPVGSMSAAGASGTGVEIQKGVASGTSKPDVKTQKSMAAGSKTAKKNVKTGSKAATSAGKTAKTAGSAAVKSAALKLPIGMTAKIVLILAAVAGIIIFCIIDVTSTLSVALLGGTSAEGGAGSEAYVEWMIAEAADESHGYRAVAGENCGNPDYDCGGFVSIALQKTGIFKNGEFGEPNDESKTYTSTLGVYLMANGFEQMDYVDRDQLVTGDILISYGHVETYIGDGKLIGAHTNCGHPEEGDQTGMEVCEGSFYENGWIHVYRYFGSTE